VEDQRLGLDDTDRVVRSARSLPSGLVTFVFTDIEGSTRLFRRIGDRYPPLLARHHEILRAAWVATGGYEVKTDGDAFFVAFADATAAVEACAQAQRALTSEPWPADAAIRVRMGLHTGLASPRGDDYIAFAVHQAARVVNAGHGGQIVASAETAERLGHLPGLTVVSLGRFRVRDFDDPVELFQITGTGLPTEFPPPRVLPADRHNLVAPPTSVVGRDDDLVTLDDLLRSSRLVSVVGPGGLGKTRLVIEYGLRHANEWDHGIWLVDLAPIVDAALVPKTVADAVAAPIGEGSDATAGVAEHLRDRHALVIMDNCERVTSGVARHVDEVLRGCAFVRVVATSREPLGLRAERIWRVPALVSADSAVQLFCDRAGLPAGLDPATRAIVVELCRLLDGLPLAIELAAARCDVLSPSEIVARLGHQRGLLRTDDPTLSARQRSLDDTIEWSHQLLTVDEQLAFRRLGVFAAGFGLEAATATVADRAIDPYDVPELVWSLVSKSLVVSEPAAGSTRYRLLDTIRAYAQRQLEMAGEMSSVAARLGRYYVNAYGPQLHKSDVELLAERGRDIDNLRALIPLVAAQDVEVAQAIACTVTIDQRRASPAAGVAEGIRHLERLPAATPTRVALLVEVARLAIDCGLIETASDLLEQAQLLADRVGSPPWIDGQIDQHRGIVALHRGDIEQAHELAVTALARTSSLFGRSRLYNLAGLVAFEQREFDDARQALERVLDLDVQLEDVESCAIDLGNLAELEMQAGRHSAAARRQLESLALAIELGSLRDVASAVIVAARLASTSDEWTTAVRLQSAADASLSEIGLTLYPSDRAACDELLTRAAKRLGVPHFNLEVEAGRTLTITDAVEQTRRVLAPRAVP
jgi:predicted ATPase/class 3 adenylate cyclase